MMCKKLIIGCIVYICLYLNMLAASIQTIVLEAGCDEAGRGCLAGPVVAAAVIFESGYHHAGLNDSKQLNEKKRFELRDVIMKEALAFAVASCSEQEIDQLNILNASILAMHRALDTLSVTPGFIAVDGNRFKPYHQIKHACVVKGDARFLHIAAASILAKTHRDEQMMKLHQEYPMFNWDKNKGYPTAEHRKKLIALGATPYHRKSFKLKELQLKLL